MNPAYYNECDQFKAEWLRQLIAKNLIAPGDVDERSIADVCGDDLREYTQCHFFAGIGVWSHALQNAGWGGDRPVWTGSCPCPSFSAAGKGLGFADPRHLWPHWYRLIRECRPPVVFGEQVAAAVGHGWLDLVCGEMEAADYAIAAAVLGAHSAGAPHIRQRLYFCADASNGDRRSGKWTAQERIGTDGIGRRRPSGSGFTGDRSDSDGGNASAEREQRSGEQRLLSEDCGVGVGDDAECDGGRTDFEERYAEGRVADGRDRTTSDGSDSTQRGLAVRGGASGITGHASRPGELGVEINAKFEGLEGHFGDVREWRGPGWLDPITARSVAEAGATRGFWSDCDWWYGRDDKYRPIGPSLQPLASGATSRVGRLRGYGDSIVGPTAQIFIEVYLDAAKDGAE